LGILPRSFTKKKAFENINISYGKQLNDVIVDLEIQLKLVMSTATHSIS
jgi:hypothetical protein